jgi:hypothetical protein
MERARVRQGLDCFPVSAPRIEGERVIPVIEVGRERVEPLCPADQLERLLPSSPVNQDVRKDGGDIGVIGIECQRPIEAGLGPCVLVAQKEDLGVDGMGPGVVTVDVQGGLDVPSASSRAAAVRDSRNVSQTIVQAMLAWARA